MDKNDLLELLKGKRLYINNDDYENVIIENRNNCFRYKEFNELFGFEEYYQLRISKLENENVFVYVPIKLEIKIEGDKLFIKHSIDGGILSKPTVKELLNNGRVLFFICTGEKDDFGNWIEDEYKYYYFGELFIYDIEHSDDNRWDLIFSYEANTELWDVNDNPVSLLKDQETGKNKTVVKVEGLIENNENYSKAKTLKESILRGYDTLKRHIINENESVDFSLQNDLTDDDIKNIINTDAYNLLINEELFHKILDPFPEGPAEVYVKIDTEEDTEEDVTKGPTKENKTVLLVKNKNMRAIDNCFYGEGEYRNRNNSLDYIYKPYIYKMHLKEPYPKIKPGKWYKVPISFSEADGFTKDGSRMLLVASPPKENEFFINWNELDIVQNVLNNSNSLNQGCVTDKIDDFNTNQMVIDAKNKLDSIFDGSITIRIYRVGQANLIYVMNGTRIAFDFGIPTKKNIKQSNKKYDDYDYLCRYYPHMVFITHWHSDHFEGLYYLSERFWQDASVFFIAPEVGDREKKYDLVKYLIKSKKLIQIDLSSAGKEVYVHGVNNRIKLFLGKDSTNDCLNPRAEENKIINSRSLLLQLNKTLLPGDCNMKYWPDDYGKDDNGNYNEYDHILIPHHGGVDCIDESKLDNYMSNDVHLYLCCGYNNEHEHPRPEIVNILNGLSDPSNGQRTVEVECTNIISERPIPENVVDRRMETITKYIEFDDE